MSVMTSQIIDNSTPGSMKIPKLPSLVLCEKKMTRFHSAKASNVEALPWPDIIRKVNPGRIFSSSDCGPYPISYRYFCNTDYDLGQNRIPRMVIGLLRFIGHDVACHLLFMLFVGKTFRIIQQAN